MNQADSQIFDKLARNSFHGTGLLQYLKDKQEEHIVIMGCKTQYCIDTAVRSAEEDLFRPTHDSYR